MFCKNCGSEISDNATFCDKCGASTKSGEIEKNVTVIYDQNVQKEATRYASTALKFALIGLLCCVCCDFHCCLEFPQFISAH
ncbi:MAG: zinc ribbon domain-containing protein [Ruminococcus sp.]|nr:zinc ribbon domain-containing protein [Ruminococcus sp.]